MHAVVYEVDMKKDWEGDADAELDMIVQASRDFPGFVRGLWLSDGTTGLAIEVLESEEAAREAAANASIPPEASVSLRSAKAYEVVREA
jgi:hypothetical protein